MAWRELIIQFLILGLSVGVLVLAASVALAAVVF